MKFAHLADVHIGAWREPRLADLPDKSFSEAMSIALEEQVDFIIIAGDLFHSALPGIDHLKATVRTLQLAKEKNVPIYIIPGSHDFSPSGKSMLHVLEEAGLLVDVFKGSIHEGKLRLMPVQDKKTGVFLTGILGRKGMLDKEQYHHLDVNNLEESLVHAQKKIFLFHTALDELKPSELKLMESSPVSFLPKGFDYYAGGHVHIVHKASINGYNSIVYPGPVFPASFSELEKLKQGNMVIVDDGKIKNIPLELKNVVPIQLMVHDESPSTITEKIIALLEREDITDAIVLLRIAGSLKEGNITDIDMKRVFACAYLKNAFVVLRNTGSLVVESLEISEMGKSSSAIEEDFIRENIGRISCPFSDEAGVARSLLRSLSKEKNEGETSLSYEHRVVEDAKHLLGLK
jgi:DNA repair exonuclease SbcCD nuclease subunit